MPRNQGDYRDQTAEISGRISMITAHRKLRGKLLLALLRTKYTAEGCEFTRM